MATQARPQNQVIPSSRLPQRPQTDHIEKAEMDLLGSVMVSVSSALEAMSAEQREQAVRDAERAVAHL
jgi:hypothetical protein